METNMGALMSCYTQPLDIGRNKHVIWSFWNICVE